MSEPALEIPAGKKIRVEITPLSRPVPLQGRVCGTCAAEATPQNATDLVTSCIRSNAWPQSRVNSATLSQDDMFAFEEQLRRAAFSTNDFFLLGLNAP